MDPITGFLLNLLLGVVLNTVGTLLGQAFAQDSKESTGTRGSVQIGGKVPQSFMVGTVGVAGKMEYPGEWGSSGGVPNVYATDVISFGDLEVSGLAGLFVNGERVTLSSSGEVEQGFPVLEYDLAGGNKFWGRFFKGNQVAADPFLLDKFADHPDRPWLVDMVGRGLPYLVTTALWHEEVWTGFPKVLAEIRGIPLYDPRKDSTAGGSGPQRWDNPSTWAFSDNNLVIVYNILRGIHYNPPQPDGSPATTLGPKVWGGDATAAQLPYAMWAAAMDKCDLDIALKGGGTEKQFRGGREVFFNERPADVIAEFLTGASARISCGADGIYDVLVGIPEVAAGAFSDADVVATEPTGAIPFPNFDDIVNGATATYREPAQAWEDKETAPYYRSDLEAKDDGQRKAKGFSLDTTFSGTQAQRILQLAVEESRRFRRHVVVLRPVFARYRVLQRLDWTSERWGHEAKAFLITAKTRDPWGNVILGLQEIDPSDQNWNPSTDERPLTFAPVTVNRPVPQEVSGPSVAPVPAELAYDVFWSAPSVAVDVQFVRVSHRRIGSTGDPDSVTLVPKPSLLTGSARVSVPIDLSRETIEVQLEYISMSGRPTVASAWMPVTIADVKLGPLDIYGLDLDNLNQSLNETIANLFGNAREILAQAQALATATADEVLANYSDHQQIRRSLSSVYGQVTADYLEAITVATGPGSAIASRIEALEVKVDQDLASAVQLLQANIATVDGKATANADALTALSSTVNDVASSVTVRGVTSASPGGGWAAWGVQVKVGSGPSDWSTGAFFIETNGSQSRAAFDVDQFIIRSGSAAMQPFIFESGVAKMMAARVGTITAGRLQNEANTTYLDLNTGAFRVSAA